MKAKKLALSYPYEIVDNTIYERKISLVLTQKQLERLNDKIAIESFFWNVPETYTNLLHSGINYIGKVGMAHVRINETIKEFFKFEEPKQFTLSRTIYEITIK